MEESSVFYDENTGDSMMDKESTDIMPLVSMGSDRLGFHSVLLSERELKKASMKSDLRVQNVEKPINVFKKEGRHCIDVTDDICGNKESDIISNQEHVFGVGDLVWIKTRTQLWWPGIVSDPKTAVKDVINPEKSPCFLVKYFGNANSMWCSSADLKPFAEDFDQLTRQKDSSNFRGAVEKALGIIGRRVKSKMTCNCILKNSEESTQDVEESSTALDNMGQQDDSAVSRFEPANFVASVKCLARAASVSNKLELTVTKNHLSAFYSSVGHLQLPLHLLKQSGDYVLNTPHGEESSTESDETGQLEDFAVSRFEPASFVASVKRLARTASVSTELELTFTKKHLSDFYSSIGHLQLPLQQLRQSGDYGLKTPDRSTSRQKRSRKDETGLVSDDIGPSSRGRKKSKYLSFPYVDVKVETEVSPSLGLKETEDSSGLSSLSSKLRPQGSNNKSNSSKLVKGHREIRQADDMDLRFGSVESMNDSEVQISPNVHLAKDETRSMKQAEIEKINLETGEGSLNDVDMIGKFTENVNCSSEEKMVCRKENTSRAEHVETVQKSVGSLDLSQNSSFEQSFSNSPKTSETLRNDLIEPPPGFGRIDTSSNLPDLNENCPSFSNDHVPPNKPFQGKSNEESVPAIEEAVDPTKADSSSSPSLKNVQETLHISEKFSHDLHKTTCARAEREKVPNVVSIGLGSFQTKDPPTTMKPHRKKMKLADEFCHITGSDTVPDLNQNAVEKSSPSTPLSEKSHISIEKNPRKKRKEKNKSDGVESGPDVKKNKGSSTKEDPGAILVLEFSPGFDIPSKGNLMSVFSRYGLINESAIQFLNDSSVQVFYERTPDAKFAFRSLEKNNPFGESLTHFKLYRKPSVSGNEEGENNSSETMQSLVPINAHETTVKARKKSSLLPKDVMNKSNKVVKTPDIAFMRKNVEMMKSTLEKVGDRLLPEVRIKLENEIKGFMDKISSMATGSPSSS